MRTFKLPVILLFVIAINGIISAQFAGGAGTSADPYQVATATQLNEVRNYLSSHFIQTANIDLIEATSTSGGAYWNGGLGWAPIGKSPSGQKFTGSYNGNGKKITGLTINRPSENEVGLFGYTGGSALRNIVMVGGSITGHTHVGGLVGWPSELTRITGCSNTGSVAGHPTAGVNAGGLAGVINDCDTVLNCFATGNVSGYNQVGGLFGNNIRSNVHKSYATGNVTGNLYVGGFGGFTNSSQTNCYATGNVSGNQRVGGFMGHTNGGTTSKCYSTGDIPNSGSYIGGFTGGNFSIIQDCYWDTQTSGTATGIADGTLTGATGKTTAEMKTQSTFTGWDFTNIWQISGSEYPDLKSAPRPPVYDVHVYLTRDNNDVNANVLYPKVGLGSAITTPFSWTPSSPDWTYNSPKCTVYVVPTGTEGVVASSFVVAFDPSLASLSAAAGDNNLFASGLFYTQATGSGRLKINASNITSGINATPGSGKYLARLIFTMLKPGNLQITLDSLDFRKYDTGTNEQIALRTEKFSADVKLYLGDFAASGSETTGDGAVNINDLSLFATSYWSIHSQPSTLYKSKFDIGPTSLSGNYFALPTPDGTINFEDLIIFSIGYGKSAGGALPKENKNPLFVSLGEEKSGDLVRVPVTLSGNVEDVRGMSFTFNTTMKLVGVEKAGELNTEKGFVISKQDGNTVRLDAALVGAEVSGLAKEGVIAYLLFENRADIEVENVIARNSWNQDMNVKLAANSLGNIIPDNFSLNQNYPNPFNPSTMISFGLPAASNVTLKIFNALGQEIVTLINGESLEAGNHSVSFDASGLTSGVYLCKLSAGNFSATRKMLLSK